MRKTETALSLSATDLSSSLACGRFAGLPAHDRKGKTLTPVVRSPSIDNVDKGQWSR